MGSFAFDTCYILGCGHMGGALLRGFLEANVLLKEQVCILNPDKAEQERLHASFGCRVDTIENVDITNNDILFLGVKPQVFNEISKDIKTSIKSAPLTLSIMAGVSIAAIEAVVSGTRIFRSMPNLPVMNAKGLIGLYAHADVSDGERQYIESLLKSVGTLQSCKNEDEINSITALAGSGPAYLYYFMEALTEAGVQLGFSETDSKAIASAVVDGAFQHYLASDEEVATLRARVTSKGGTTEAALKLLEEQSVKKHFVSAIKAAKNRADELSEL